jgi:cation:H+ antiporter
VDVVAAFVAITLFIAGAALAIWATEKLLEGLVGLAALTALSTFVIGALLSGLEAENIAVGIAAGVRNASAIAFGTVFGGATFLVTMALGVGAVIAPLQVRLPRGFLVIIAAAPLLAGVVLIGDRTTPVQGVVLLVAFGAAMGYVVRQSRHRTFLLSHEVEEAQAEHHRWPVVVGITLLGLAGLALGGELVAEGAERLIASLGLPALLVGMVLTPAAIEIEEVFRQAIPARRGHPEVSAANLLGTLLYFVLFNLGLIALVVPLAVPSQIRTLEWPFLVGVTWLATVFLARGRVGRPEGALLILCYVGYVALHVL